VHREYHRSLGGNAPDGSEQLAHALLMINVGGPVHRHQCILFRFQSELLKDGGLGRLFPELDEGVDHQIADEKDFFVRNPFLTEVINATLLSDEKLVGNAVRHEPINLLRHAAISTAQARLHMGYPDVHLIRNERAGKRRVDIPNDNHQVRLFLLDDRFEGCHDAGRLLRVAPASYSQIHVGPGQLQLAEEDIAHLFVVVLARMHNFGLEPIVLLQGPVQGSHLHKIWARANDAKDFHAASARVALRVRSSLH
jgi:hypothetical protein